MISRSFLFCLLVLLGFSMTLAQLPSTYYYIQSANSVPFTAWVNGTYTSLPDSDDAVVTAPLGFTFNFYGVPYTTCSMSTNGNIQFATASTTYNPPAMPIDNALYLPVIGFFFTDLNARLNGQPIYRMEGTSPNRQFVVRLNNVSLISYSDRNVIADVILYETTNEIEMRYYQVPATTNGVVIGLENGGGQRADGSFDYTVFWNDVAFTETTSANLVGQKIRWYVNASIPAPLPMSYNITRTTTLPAYLPLDNPTIIPASDDFVNTIPLGFSFNFYNTFYDTVNVSTNGELQFISDVVSTATPRMPLATATRAPFIAFLSTNLYPQCTNCTQYRTSGLSPNRVFVLRLINVPYYATRTSTAPASVSVDVILYESNNDIEIRYYRVDVSSQYVLIGVQGPPILRTDSTFDYTSYLNYITLSAANANGLNGTAIRFVGNNLAGNNSDVGGDIRYDLTVQNGVVARPTYTNSVPITILDDAVVTAIPLGFTFTFYGVVNAHEITLGSNGNLQFLTAASQAYSSSMPYGSASISPYIAFYWVDLYPPYGSVDYTQVGTAPNRQFVLRYTNVPYYWSRVPLVANLTCDVILYETSNIIEMRYYSVPNTTAGVNIGLESNTRYSNNTIRYSAFWNYQVVTDDNRGQIVDKTLIFTPVATEYVPPTPVPVSYTITTSASVPTRIAFTNISYIPGADEGVQVIDLGFYFTYYGSAFGQIRVGSNGEFHFTRTQAGRTPGAFPLGSANLLPLMAFFYVDLKPTTSLMRTYQTFGTAPNKYFVMRWEDVPYYSCSSIKNSFDVILYQNNSAIEIRYYTIGTCTSANVVIGTQASTIRRSDYTYDYSALLNYQSMTSTLAAQLTGTTVFFTPINTYTPPTPFAPIVSGDSYTYTIEYLSEPRINLFEPIPLTLTDESVTPVALGFNFVFYGETYQTVRLSSNGNMQFKTSSSSTYPSATPSNNNGASPFIALLWSDLNPAFGGSVVYGITGRPGSRKFVFRYDNVPWYNARTTQNSFDCILFEEDNHIEIQYFKVSPPSYSVMAGGIQKNGSEYLIIHNYGTISSNGHAAMLAGSKISFYPSFQTTPVPVNRYQYTLTTNAGSTTWGTLTGAVAISKNDDTNTPVIDMGFTFPFYGLSYPYCSINSNGNIQFITNNNFANANPLPVGFISSPAIYFAWTNLYANTNAVMQYQKNSTAKTFTVRFLNVPYYSAAAVAGDINAPSISVDVILYGLTGNIEIRYYRLDQTATPVQIGIESSPHGDLSSEYITYHNALPINSTVSTALVGSSLYFTNLNTSTPYVARQSVRPVYPKPFSQGTYQTTYLTGVQSWAMDNLTTLNMPFGANSVRVNIGFNFQFFAQQYSQVYIDRHGVLAFDAQPVGVPSMLPNPINNTNQYISFAGFNFLDDIGSIAYALSNGTVGSRYFIVRFDRQYSNNFGQTSAGFLIADVLLYEADSRIEIRYYYSSPTYSRFFIGVVGSATDYSYLLNGAWLTEPVAAAMKYASVIFSRSAFTYPSPLPSSYTSTETSDAPSSPPTLTNAIALPASNDNIDTIRLNFAFTFFGRMYWALNISANGEIQFQTAEVDYDPDPLPFGNVALAPVLAYFYTDLYPNFANSRVYATSGTTPNRIFTLRLTNVPYFTEKDVSPLPTVTLDVNLYEFDSKIEVIYYTIGQSSQNVLVGIEGQPFLRSDYLPDFVAVRNVVPIDSNLVTSLQGKRVTFTSRTPIPTGPYVGPIYYQAVVQSGNTRPTLSSPIVLNPSANADDTVYADLPIGFTFNFYGVDYTNITMSSNGNIQFRSPGSTARTASPLPLNHATEMPFIAAYLTDLYASAGDLKYQTIGSGSSRQFVARYENVDRCCSVGAGAFSFDIILTESTNNIQIQYYSLGTSGTATILIGTQASQQPRADGSYDYTAYWNALADTEVMRTALVGNTLVFQRNTGGSIVPPVPLTYAVSRSTSIPTYAPLTGATYIAGSDEGVDIIPIGFAFAFYDNTYSSLYVGSNGNLQFATSTASRLPLPLPYADSAMLPLFAFFFTDLNPFNNTMKSYALSGSNPNRILTIRFDRVPYGLCRNAYVTIDVKLYEIDTHIDVIYYSVSECRQQAVIIGLQKDGVRRSDYTIDYLTFLNQIIVNTATVNQLNGAMISFRRTSTIPTPTQLHLVSVGAYNVSQIQGSQFIAMTNPTTLATGSAMRTVSLGFNFNFYGVPYNQIILTSNGIVRFVGGTTVTQSQEIPTGNAPQVPFIAFFYGYQLYYTSIGIDRYYTTMGTVGARVFILRFDNAQYYSTSANNIAVDLLLFEADGRIEMRYHSVMPTDSYTALIGIQGPNSTIGYDYAVALNSIVVDDALAGLLTGTTMVFQSIVPIVPINPRAVTYTSTVATTTATRETLPSPGYIGNANDGVTGPVSIGFQFTFYDVAYDSLSISTNGNIQFGSSYAGITTSPMPLQIRTQIPIIAFAYTDLTINSSQASYKMLGTAPNRYFIVRFQNAPYSHVASQGVVDVDCILYESDSHIEMRYYSISPSIDQMLIGIESHVYSDSNTMFVAYRNNVAMDAASATALTGKTITFSITNSVTYVNGPIRPSLPTAYYQGTYNASIISSPTREVLTAPTTLVCCTYIPSLDLGFDFIFMGVSYNSVYFDVYGRLSFTSTTTISSPDPLPYGNTNVAPFISFAWSDLYRFRTGFGTYQYTTVGTAPNRYFILQLTDISYSYSPYERAISVDVVLFENDGRIELRYYRLDPLSETGLLIGIQGAAVGRTFDFAVVMNDAFVSASTSAGLASSTVVFRAVSGRAVVVPQPPVYVTYAISTMPTPILDVFTNPTNISFTDDSVRVVPFGFNFRFFQNIYTSGNISSNGNMQFRTSTTSYIPQPLPDGNPLVEPLLAMFFTDLAPNYAASTPQYQTFGTPPNRYLVVRHTNIPYCCSDTNPKVSYDLLLFETTNRIEIRFTNVDAQIASRNVLIGVDDAAATPEGMPDFAVLVNAQPISESVVSRLRNTTVVIQFATYGSSSSSSTGGSVPAVSSSSAGTPVLSSSASTPVLSSSAGSQSQSSSAPSVIVDVGCPALTSIPTGSAPVAVLISRPIDSLGPSFGSSFSNLIGANVLGLSDPSIIGCNKVTTSDGRSSNTLQPTAGQSYVTLYILAKNSGVDVNAIATDFQTKINNGRLSEVLNLNGYTYVGSERLTACPDGSFVSFGQPCPGSSGSSGLSGGAIAGIVIGVIVGVVVLVVLAFFLVQRSKSQGYSNQEDKYAGKAYAPDEHSEVAHTGHADGDADEVELANVRNDDEYAHEYSQNEMKTNDDHHQDGEHDETALV